MINIHLIILFIFYRLIIGLEESLPRNFNPCSTKLFFGEDQLTSKEHLRSRILAEQDFIEILIRFFFNSYEI